MEPAETAASLVRRVGDPPVPVGPGDDGADPGFHEAGVGGPPLGVLKAARCGSTPLIWRCSPPPERATGAFGIMVVDSPGIGDRASMTGDRATINRAAVSVRESGARRK